MRQSFERSVSSGISHKTTNAAGFVCHIRQRCGRAVCDAGGPPRDSGRPATFSCMNEHRQQTRQATVNLRTNKCAHSIVWPSGEIDQVCGDKGSLWFVRTTAGWAPRPPKGVRLVSADDASSPQFLNQSTETQTRWPTAADGETLRKLPATTKPSTLSEDETG